MKILVDIGHPGHYHLHKNVIKRALSKGYKVVVVLREKDNAGFLLKDMPVKIYSIGAHKKGIVGKALNSLLILIKVYRIIRKEKPDIAIGEGSFYITQPTWLNRIPSIMIAMNDHAWFENALFSPFCTKIITSDTFKHDFRKKHIRFKGYLQWLYLMNYTPSDANIELGLVNGERYGLIRLVHWGAHHDIGKYGLDEAQVLKIIDNLANDFKIFISAEKPLSEKLKKYALQTKPNQFQDVLYHSSLCISEGATVAAEAAIIGIPTIYTSNISPGYIEGMAKDGMIYHLKDAKDTSELLSFLEKMKKGESIEAASKFREKYDNVLEIFWAQIAAEGERS